MANLSGKGKVSERSLDKILKAIRGSRGLQSLIAKRLNVGHRTVRRYLERWPEAQELYEEEVGCVLDMAEDALFTAIEKQRPWAIKFFLSTLGRSRGYAEDSSGRIVNIGAAIFQVDFGSWQKECQARLTGYLRSIGAPEETLANYRALLPRLPSYSEEFLSEREVIEGHVIDREVADPTTGELRERLVDECLRETQGRSVEPELLKEKERMLRQWRQWEKLRREG